MALSPPRRVQRQAPREGGLGEEAASWFCHCARAHACSVSGATKHSPQSPGVPFAASSKAEDRPRAMSEQALGGCPALVLALRRSKSNGQGPAEGRDTKARFGGRRPGWVSPSGRDKHTFPRHQHLGAARGYQPEVLTVCSRGGDEIQRLSAIVCATTPGFQLCLRCFHKE